MQRVLRTTFLQQVEKDRVWIAYVEEALYSYRARWRDDDEIVKLRAQITKLSVKANMWLDKGEYLLALNEMLAIHSFANQARARHIEVEALAFEIQVIDSNNRRSGKGGRKNRPGRNQNISKYLATIHDARLNERGYTKELAGKLQRGEIADCTGIDQKYLGILISAERLRRSKREISS